MPIMPVKLRLLRFTVIPDSSQAIGLPSETVP